MGVIEQGFDVQHTVALVAGEVGGIEAEEALEDFNGTLVDGCRHMEGAFDEKRVWVSSYHMVCKRG